MEQSKYNLMTSGNIKPGFEWKDVESRFAELCKVSPEKARMLVENERVLKKNLDLKNAELYQHKLENIGVEIRLVELPVAPPEEPSLSMAMEPLENEIESTPQVSPQASIQETP